MFPTKGDTVSMILLIIPPCQVVATNMSDSNKHKVLERVIEGQKMIAQRKPGSSERDRDKGSTKDKALKESLVKFFFFFQQATIYSREWI